MTICRTSVAIAKLLCDRGHVLRLHVRLVTVVDRDDGRPAAAAEALDRPQGYEAVVARLPCGDAELALKPLEDLLRRQRRRAPVGVALLELLHLVVVRAHLSTSPITVSSEPTIAIRSATRASVMHVAVASSATKEGARNLTRHGFGPPFDTT